MRTKISATGNMMPARGFTLVEILVVLAIITILAGAIIPRMTRSLSERELRETAAAMVHTMQTAHALAMAQQKTYAVGVDMERGGWMVMSSSDTSGQMEPVRMSWLKGGRFPAGVRMTGFRTPKGGGPEGRGEVRFLPDGSSSGAAIRLECVGKTMSVMVQPHNGRAVYAENEGERFSGDQYDLGD